MRARSCRMLAIAGVATAVLAVAACGGSDQKGNAGRASTPSIGASTGASTPSTSATAATTEASTQASGDASGLVDAMTRTLTEGKSAHITLDMGSQGSGEGDVVFAGKDSAMQLRLKTAGQTTQMRLVDTAIYVQVPGQQGKWMKMSAGQAGSALAMDPSRTLEQLKAAGGSAKDLGDGHWQVSQGAVTTDVYVGEDGYLDKVETSAGAGATMTMTYSDWGKRVSVEAPPRSDIVDMPTS
ncbi:hypothetical protein JCM18899A_47920 [Nocardioides sp. AN3]